MEFPNISKEKWKEKIETELRGKKTLEDLQYTIGTELDVDVLLQEPDRIEHDDLDVPKVVLSGIYFEGIPKNKLILEALSKGASAIYFNGKQTDDWKKLLNGVNTSYINVIVNDTNTISEYQDQDIFKPENAFELKTDRILDISKSIESGNLIEDIQSITSVGGNFGVVMNDAFILNIAIIRALRLIQKGNQQTGKIIAFLSGGEENLEYQLIRYTTQASAAITGGSDYLFFPIHKECSVNDVSKIIHIDNVLSMESKLNRYNDPWKGAYVIEHITHHIIEKIKGGP